MSRRTPRRQRRQRIEAELMARRGELVMLSTARTAMSGLMVIVAFGCVGLATAFRDVEALIAPHSFALAGMGPARSLGNGSFLTLGTGEPVKFTVTAQCGALLLVAPLCFASALVVRSPLVPLGRAAAALGLGAVLLVVANQIRLLIIGGLITGIGFKTGFPLGHLLIGSLFSLAAIGSSVLAYLRAVNAEPLRAAVTPRAVASDEEERS